MSATFGSLNPASITVNIQISQLKDFPHNLMGEVKAISSQTGTHIFTFDRATHFAGFRGNIHTEFTREVKYRIYGKWRDCYFGAVLLWRRLTKPHVAYVHPSWTNVLDSHVPEHDVSLKHLFNVSCEKVQSLNVLSLSGFYWDVNKLQKELVLRTKKKVAKMSGELLVMDYASDSIHEETECLEILSQIKSYIESSINQYQASLQAQKLNLNFNSFPLLKNLMIPEGLQDHPKVNTQNHLSLLKATEVLRLLVGPEEYAPNVPKSQIDSFEGDAHDMEPNELKTNEPSSIVYIPGEDVPVFASEIEYAKEEEKEFRHREVKMNELDVIDDDFEHLLELPVLRAKSTTNSYINDKSTSSRRSSNFSRSSSVSSRQSSLKSRSSGSPSILDDIDLLEDIDFP